MLHRLAERTARLSRNRATLRRRHHLSRCWPGWHTLPRWQLLVDADLSQALAPAAFGHALGNHSTVQLGSLPSECSGLRCRTEQNGDLDGAKPILSPSARHEATQRKVKPRSTRADAFPYLTLAVCNVSAQCWQRTPTKNEVKLKVVEAPVGPLLGLEKEAPEKRGFRRKSFRIC